jgi:RNA polymerase sigma factor (sigma-70 family)
MSIPEKEFNALLVKYRPFVTSQVIRYGGGENTEDLAQDVMVHVCRFRRNFDPDKGGFVTWLWWQIRSCLQQRRLHARKRRDVNHSMEYHDDGTPLTEAVTFDDPLARIELRETLDAACSLQPREAHAVLQRAVGATFGEIGAEYDASSQYAQQLHTLGMKNLRRKMNRRPAMMGAI